jgi:hypothetical protein
MKKEIILLGIILIFVSGCWDGYGPTKPTNFKEIETAPIPPQCAQHHEDACALLKCLVKGCWCKQDPIFPFETHTNITNEEEATQAVNALLAEMRYGQGDILDREMVVRSIIETKKINSVFWLVFVDAHGTEEQYAVAADGTINQMICGS